MELMDLVRQDRKRTRLSRKSPNPRPRSSPWTPTMKPLTSTTPSTEAKEDREAREKREEEISLSGMEWREEGHSWGGRESEEDDGCPTFENF